MLRRKRVDSSKPWKRGSSWAQKRSCCCSQLLEETLEERVSSSIIGAAASLQEWPEKRAGIQLGQIWSTANFRATHTHSKISHKLRSLSSFRNFSIVQNFLCPQIQAHDNSGGSMAVAYFLRRIPFIHKTMMLLEQLLVCQATPLILIYTYLKV